MKQRIAKEGPVRKQELLDHALNLFSLKGYEDTTINDIINSVGVSKGAFYHYFKSKEEVLDTIIRNYMTEIVDLTKKIADDPNKSALEKYLILFEKIQEKRKQNREKFYFLSVMMVSDKNVLFFHRYQQEVVLLTRGPLAKILTQGKKSGEFNIDDPVETAEHIIYFGNIYRTKLWRLFLGLKENPENSREIDRLLRFMQFTIERILGVQTGTLAIIYDSFRRQLNN